MPGVHDFNFDALVQDPLDYTQRLYRKLELELQAQAPVPQNWDSKILKELQDVLDKNSGNWAKIPLLNSFSGTELSGLRNNCLVRWQAMIQDSFNPELYQKIYHYENPSSGSGSTVGLFRDSFTVPRGRSPSSGDEEVLGNLDYKNCLGERSVYWTVSLPGLNPWVNELSLQTGFPRTLGDNFEKSPKGTGTEVGGGIGDGGDLRRNLWNFPLSSMHQDPKNRAVLIKTYNESAKESDASQSSFLLQEAYEFIGVLCTKDPSCPSALMDFQISTGNIQESELDEEKVHNPPFGWVPRLHVIQAQKLSRSQLPLPRPMEGPGSGGLEESRSLVLGLLSDCFGGDSVVAEYVLANLFSQVCSRNSATPVGNFSLNVKIGHPLSSPSGTRETLDSLISFLKTQVLPALLPSTVSLDVSLDSLNSGSWIPRKDYDLDRLKSGSLQLSPGTHLVLDERKLGTGPLSTNGLENLRALKELVNQQVLRPGLQYHSTVCHMDIPTLLLAHTKSILEPMVIIDLVPKLLTDSELSETIARVETALQDTELLSKLRAYLSSCRSLCEFDLSPALEEVIQSRETWKEVGGTAEGLHVALTLARTLSYSYGETSLSLENWKHTIELEKVRRERTKRTTH